MQLSNVLSKAHITCSGLQTPGIANDSSTSAPHSNFTNGGPEALFGCAECNITTTHNNIYQLILCFYQTMLC